MSETNWTVYIIEAENGSFYTGITTNLERRFKQHKNLTGARFFHTSPANRICYQESQPNRSEASKREAAIKKLSRQGKIKLIASIKVKPTI